LVFAGFEHLFPREGSALDVACGRGSASVWLAMRNVEVLGIDVSPVAIDQARALAAANGVTDRCRFMVHDLAHGLPPGPSVDLVLCHKYRDPALDAAMVNRLSPKGLLAIATLSEVDVGPGRFRSRPGELRDAFAMLEPLAGGEADGVAWLIGRKPAD
jgi:2-polyprenyl-3-methyl-5-hydroxy-6-metoxy-1,4-benzoquinol methylase